MILTVTTTSGRPKALAALEKWLKAQTTDDYHWLIVSDDWEDYKFPKNATVLKRDNVADTLPSICENWLYAIQWIEEHPEYDRILCLEDDDYYSPGYIRETSKLFEHGDLVGWHEDAYYYVLSRRARKFHNIGYASLAATGFKRCVLPYLKKCCQAGQVFIDMLLWKGISQTSLMQQPPVTLPDGMKVSVPPVPVSSIVDQFTGPKVLADNFTGIIWGSKDEPKLDKDGNIVNEHPRHVGIKQNWHGGKEGLSVRSHEPSSGGPDIWGDRLKKWIGEDDAKFYLKLVQEVPKNPYPAGLMLPLPIDNVA